MHFFEKSVFQLTKNVIIDRIAKRIKEIMPLVASLRLSVCLSALSRLNHHYQSKVIVCVSVISWRLQIIVQMGSIGF